MQPLSRIGNDTFRFGRAGNESLRGIRQCSLLTSMKDVDEVSGNTLLEASSLWRIEFNKVNDNLWFCG